MRIFLIENNDQTREALGEFFEGDGHEIISMNNGEEALRAFRLDPAPVVILDQMLVGFESLDLLETIKSEHPETEVIVTTNIPSIDSLATVMRMDALDYLDKTDGLLDAMNDALKRAEEHIDRRQQRKTELTELHIKIAKLEEDNRLLAMNCCDSQTGLYDQTLFEEAVAAEIERGKQNNRIFSLVLIRLNPDLYVGNKDYDVCVSEETLPTLAQLIHDRLRKSDLLARYDNHTFSMILPETGREGATLVAESIASLCVDLITSIMPEPARPQAILQVGVACYPEDSHDQAELLNIAGQRTTVYSDSIH